MNEKRKITEFRGEYFFCSNFYEAPIHYAGLIFNNNEAAFQAMKCPARKAEFCTLNPSAAKRLGRQVALRADWEAVKEQTMYEICRQKFIEHPELLKKLKETDNAELIEGNSWGDREWGVCNGQGKNKLGKILMRLRDEL